MLMARTTYTHFGGSSDPWVESTCKESLKSIQSIYPSIILGIFVVIATTLVVYVLSSGDPTPNPHDFTIDLSDSEYYFGRPIYKANSSTNAKYISAECLGGIRVRMVAEAYTDVTIDISTGELTQPNVKLIQYIYDDSGNSLVRAAEVRLNPDNTEHRVVLSAISSEKTESFVYVVYTGEYMDGIIDINSIKFSSSKGISISPVHSEKPKHFIRAIGDSLTMSWMNTAIGTETYTDTTNGYVVQLLEKAGKLHETNLDLYGYSGRGIVVNYSGRMTYTVPILLQSRQIMPGYREHVYENAYLFIFLGTNDMNGGFFDYDAIEAKLYSVIQDELSVITDMVQAADKVSLVLLSGIYKGTGMKAVHEKIIIELQSSDYEDVNARLVDFDHIYNDIERLMGEHPSASGYSTMASELIEDSVI